jgi:hypothetical protein
MVNGKQVLAEKQKGLRLVPFNELHLEVEKRKEGFAVIISSAKWTIDGCGVGTGNGEMVIHSIGGRKNQTGGKLVVKEPGSRSDYRIFVEDSRGHRHLIP